MSKQNNKFQEINSTLSGNSLILFMLVSLVLFISLVSIVVIPVMPVYSAVLTPPAQLFQFDRDRDGIYDFKDNCISTYNPNQKDLDKDGIGDACDPDPGIDSDRDGIVDSKDNCPTVYNPLPVYEGNVYLEPIQEDSDYDGIGDACDYDLFDNDGDGVPNGQDNCMHIANPGQENNVRDHRAGSVDYGDACDPDIPTSDTDGDGVPNGQDNCPSVSNRDQSDVIPSPNGNGIGDICESGVIYNKKTKEDFVERGFGGNMVLDNKELEPMQSKSMSDNDTLTVEEESSPNRDTQNLPDFDTSDSNEPDSSDMTKGNIEEQNQEDLSKEIPTESVNTIEEFDET